MTAIVGFSYPNRVPAVYRTNSNLYAGNGSAR